MKELLSLIKAFNLKALFKEETHNPFVQFFRYIFVGGVATVVDWTVLELLYLVHHDGLYFSTAIGFMFGLVVNFLLSKFFVFKGTPSNKHVVLDIIVYIVTGLIGLLFTEAIMWLVATRWSTNHVIAKAIATVIVLIWNFGSKKLILYRKRDHE